MKTVVFEFQTLELSEMTPGGQSTWRRVFFPSFFRSNMERDILSRFTGVLVRSNISEDIVFNKESPIRIVFDPILTLDGKEIYRFSIKGMEFYHKLKIIRFSYVKTGNIGYFSYFLGAPPDVDLAPPTPIEKIILDWLEKNLEFFFIQLKSELESKRKTEYEQWLSQYVFHSHEIKPLRREHVEDEDTILSRLCFAKKGD